MLVYGGGCGRYYIVLGVWCFVFVFFKQKTAYEMRISDWSSDVCSSDLIVFDGDSVAEAVAEFNRYNIRKIELADAGLGEQKMVGRFRTNEPDAFARAVATLMKEIGRASCRERVCPYV